MMSFGVLELLFVLYFLAAIFLLKSHRTNGLVILGLLVLGANGALFFLRRSGAIDVDARTLQTLSRVLFGSGLASLTIGAFALAFPRIKTSGGDGASDIALQALLIPRSGETTYHRAVVLRDELYEQFADAFRQQGVVPTGYKSPEQSAQVWLQFDLLFPDSDTVSLRSGLIIGIQQFDFHRFEHLLDVDVRFAGKRFVTTGVITLPDEHVNGIARFVAGRGGHKPPRLARIRSSPLQLWRPSNKIPRVRPDYARAVLVVLGILLFAVPLGFLGSIAIFVWLAITWGRRKIYVLTTGKPMVDPRSLQRMDSWQANIDGLGADAADVRARLIRQLRSSAGSATRVDNERIWYAGVDGKVERTQVVVTFRRAVGFVHVEPYGKDLYVGWDSHVNTATWLEQPSGSGIDRETGKRVVVNRIISGWQQPNEYDITDANFLTEWLHTNVVRLIRQKMEEHKIDQEIDFTVQRESRRSVLGASQPTGGSTQKRSLGSLLRRTG